ncbi:hypothetical protein BC826DRAFT_725957 [Russula brevipes]|nr:hypothetical protein BC826DRAFT_725957 [Russula brevipes]
MKLFAIASIFAFGSILVSGGAINIDKRQNICTDGACSVTCQDAKATAPSVDDCVGLIEYIASYAPGSLTLAAGQTYTWTNLTCTIAVANADTVPYSICYETIAYDAAVAGDTCLGKSTAAVCAGTGKSGDAYEVAIG